MKKGILVQFDGSNFYNKVKKILPQVHLTNYNYAGLARLITKTSPNQVIYYVGEIRKYPGNKKKVYLISSDTDLLPAIKTAKMVLC